MKAIFLLAATTAAASKHSHVGYGPLNPVLGTHGFPDCVPGPKGVTSDVEANQFHMVCSQRPAPATALKIACVGDSITAGAHSSGGMHPYPQQLQLLLDPANYSVTNLGACGSTMQKGADSPYWKRPQFAALTASKWDVVVVMLGTVRVSAEAQARPPSAPLRPLTHLPLPPHPPLRMTPRMQWITGPRTGAVALTCPTSLLRAASLRRTTWPLLRCCAPWAPPQARRQSSTWLPPPPSCSTAALAQIRRSSTACSPSSSP
jgi:hypothetical protein